MAGAGGRSRASPARGAAKPTRAGSVAIGSQAAQAAFAAP